MFLNEPDLQTPPSQASDQIRQLWRIHHRQMLNMRNQSSDTPDQQSDKSLETTHPDNVQDICGQASFSAANQRPKDFNLFQASVRNQLNELNSAHSDLREQFKEAGVEIEKNLARVETLTDQIQQAFNDCVIYFNEFESRENRLKTLHSQAIQKSQELGQKIQLEVLASSSNRSQLLAIIDDLTEQLKQVRASSVKTESLDVEKQAHSATKQIVQNKDRQISELEAEIKSLNTSLQHMGLQVTSQKQDMTKMGQQTRRLEGIIEGQNGEIEDLLVRRGQLEQEVSRLKSLVELTQSSKDKIILKLKQEMRLQQQQQTASIVTMNGTLTNNSQVAAAYTHAANNISYNNLNASPRPDYQHQQQHQVNSQTKGSSYRQ